MAEAATAEDPPSGSSIDAKEEQERRPEDDDEEKDHLESREPPLLDPDPAEATKDAVKDVMTDESISQKIDKLVSNGDIENVPTLIEQPTISTVNK